MKKSFITLGSDCDVLLNVRECMKKKKTRICLGMLFFFGLPIWAIVHPNSMQVG